MSKQLHLTQSAGLLNLMQDQSACATHQPYHLPGHGAVI